jgi:hypothetical protein
MLGASYEQGTGRRPRIGGALWQGPWLRASPQGALVVAERDRRGRDMTFIGSLLPKRVPFIVAELCCPRCACGEAARLDLARTTAGLILAPKIAF